MRKSLKKTRSNKQVEYTKQRSGDVYKRQSKERAIRYVSQDPALGGATITLGGMAKGSGMIMPNMATMIAVITTDAPLAPEVLHLSLIHILYEAQRQDPRSRDHAESP